MNTCQFSPDRSYRYTLEHRWGDTPDLLSHTDGWDGPPPLRRIMWIGLNPSTADENQLDPTLRRIKAFSQAWGFNCFVMTNLFAYRATKPEDMKRQEDPIGPQNDETLYRLARTSEMIVAAWGAHGTHLQRGSRVWMMLKNASVRPVHCLVRNNDGSPKHPLYVKGDVRPRIYAA